MTQPTYTDSFESRTTMHDECVALLRADYLVKLEPEPQGDPFGFDVRTALPWRNRDLWDVKTQDASGIFRVSVKAWTGYQNNADSVWIVVGTHRPPNPEMLVPFDVLCVFRPPAVVLPSGDPGFEFDLTSERRRVYRDTLRELYTDAVMDDPTRLVDRLRCSNCREWKPMGAFALNTTTRRGLQSNCRKCDRERPWLPEDDPRRRTP